jgi:hypothetical protein
MNGALFICTNYVPGSACAADFVSFDPSRNASSDSSYEEKTMKKICKRFAALCLVLLFSFPSAFGWGSASHAYIAERLNNKAPLYMLNQAYGAMAPDVFNLMSPASLSLLTHCNDWAQIWRLPALPTGKALAFGFVSHNQNWGADWFAHHPGCCGLSPTDGYVHRMAVALNFTLLSDPNYGGYYQALFKQLDTLDPNLRMELLRDLVEYAVDILVKRTDPAIGAKVMFAAAFRSPEFPWMLTAAYSDDVAAFLPTRSRIDAAKLILDAEADFQKTTLAYGQALMLSEGEVVEVFSEQLTAMAGAYGIPPTAKPLVAGALQAAISICSQSDPNYNYNVALANAIQMVKVSMAKYKY